MEELLEVLKRVKPGVDFENNNNLIDEEVVTRVIGTQGA